MATMTRGKPRKRTTPDNKKDNEVEELKKKLEELQGIISSLQPHSDEKEDARRDDSDELHMDDYIRVMSLCPHDLYLTTLAKGEGKKFVFHNLGEIKNILYRDLIDVMENHTEFTDFLREGYYYILDKRVIRRHGLDDLYKTLLTKEKIEEIIDTGINSIELFESANDTQKRFICEILIKSMIDGKEVDLNFVDTVSRICNVNIKEKVEYAKSLRK